MDLIDQARALAARRMTRNSLATARRANSMNTYGHLGAPLDITAMLLAKIAGRTYRQIGDQFGVSGACAFRRIRTHAKRLGVLV